MFFLLKPTRAFLNDSCTELIETYRAVKDKPEKVIIAARSIKMDKESYYAVRANRNSESKARAGEFLYLNRACFNGLYRVNSRGEFNVPWGAPKTDFVVDAENLRACQLALSGAGIEVSTGDFEDALSQCRGGDLVFLDPPYVTRHNNNGFIDYNERLFGWEDQRRLALQAEKLRGSGCHVIVTNALHAEVLALYPKFIVHELRRSSTLASSAARRGLVSEAILVGRPS